MTHPEEDLEPSDHFASEERDIEAPSADTLEQATPANPADQEAPIHRGLEVDDYDALEQSRVVDLNEDDYR